MQGCNEMGARGRNSPGTESLWAPPKSPNNVTSTFFNAVHLLPKDLRFEHGGTKLASCPGRHLISLRPWMCACVYPGIDNSSMHFFVLLMNNRKKSIVFIQTSWSNYSNAQYISQNGSKYIRQKHRKSLLLAWSVTHSMDLNQGWTINLAWRSLYEGGN